MGMRSSAHTPITSRKPAERRDNNRVAACVPGLRERPGSGVVRFAGYVYASCRSPAERWAPPLSPSCARVYVFVFVCVRGASAQARALESVCVLERVRDSLSHWYRLSVRVCLGGTVHERAHVRVNIRTFSVCVVVPCGWLCMRACVCACERCSFCAGTRCTACQ